MSVGRRHFRVREFFDIAWKLADQEMSGQGKIMNISFSGVLLQTDRVFRPSDNCVLTIERGAVEENLPFNSKKGKMMWFRRIHTPQEGFQCGIQFLDRADVPLQQWLEKKIEQLTTTTDTNILGHLAN